MGDLAGDIDGFPLFRARCCRDWPVYLGVRMLPCGYCGIVPTIIEEWQR